MKGARKYIVSPRRGDGGDCSCDEASYQTDYSRFANGYKVKIHAVPCEGDCCWCKKEQRYVLKVTCSESLSSNKQVVVSASWHLMYISLWCVSFQMSITSSIWELCAEENLLAPITSLIMYSRQSTMYRKQKILLRDRDLKDNIMAVQRRIPRSSLHLNYAPFLIYYHILYIM